MSGTTVQAYFCLDDIVAVDGSGYNPSGSAKVGGLYIVDPVSGNQTPISTGGYLGQAASVTLEPGTGKILASSRTYGVVRVDPKDGSQEVLLKGGTGWGTGYPTFLDSASNVTKPFVYAAGITIDPMDSSILVTDTGIDLTSAACTPNNVTTCGRFPGRIIRIKKGLGAGVYAGTAVVSEAGSLVAPFDLAVDGGSSLYVTDMNAKLGGANDPGMGGIIYLNASNGYAQSTFFSSYNSASPSSAGCPMGITINGFGTIFATVFSYNGFGCSPQAVFSLKPDPSGISPPTFNMVVSAAPGSPGYPSLQYPFGMDTDRSGNVIIADEGSGYGCGGTIFRLNPANAIVTTANGLWNGLIPGNLNPLAISPMVGLGCTPPGQAFLVTPADVVVTKTVVSVNIAIKQTPAITWGTPAPITYGTALSSAQLNATASVGGTSVPGTFAYTPAAGTVLPAGPQTLSVTFTPTDTTSYTTPPPIAVTLTLNQATPAITWANPAAITYGTALSSTQLNATASFNGTNLAGTFAYSPASGTVLSAGSQTLSATFTPTDTANYTTATATMTLTVNQAAPTITWANPVAITYGTALGSTQLNATASVGGTFAYSPAAGTVLSTGSQTLSVTFTPNDTADYNTATASVTLIVNPAATTMSVGTAPNPSVFNTPVTLTATVSSASATVNEGTVSFSSVDGLTTTGLCTASVTSGVATCSTSALPVGTHGITATYVDSSTTARFMGSSSSNTLNQLVNRRSTTTTVSFSSNPVAIYSPVTVMVTVADSDIGSAIIPSGTVTFTSDESSDGSATCTLSAGSCSWTFTPVVPNGRFITASYGGDTTHLPGDDKAQTSATLMVTADMLSKQVCISAPFNALPIAGGNTIWFNSVFQTKGKDVTTLTHLTFYNQTIQIGSGAPIGIPDAFITFNPSASSAVTSFDSTKNAWQTTFPTTDLDGEYLLGGAGYTVPAAGLPGGTRPVTWCGYFSSDRPLKVAWEWGAAVYKTFNNDPNALGAKPVDNKNASQYKNSDHAGTPENYKSFLIGGARGGGGSNFTGSLTKDDPTKIQ